MAHLKMQEGFTLIELMVALIIGLILMAGIYSNFIMQSRVQTMQSDVTERMEDLYLASHIMQGELRVAGSGSIDTGTTDQIKYDDLEGNPGVFRYTGSATPVDSEISWDIPNNGTGFQELMRNMHATDGMVVAGPDAYGVLTITLNASYENKDHVTQSVGLTFKIWPRN